jgi:DNA-binding CsgD family transcriptional regulator
VGSSRITSAGWAPLVALALAQSALWPMFQVQCMWTFVPGPYQEFVPPQTSCFVLSSIIAGLALCAVGPGRARGRRPERLAAPFGSLGLAFVALGALVPSLTSGTPQAVATCALAALEGACFGCLFLLWMGLVCRLARDRGAAAVSAALVASAMLAAAVEPLALACVPLMRAIHVGAYLLPMVAAPLVHRHAGPAAVTGGGGEPASAPEGARLRPIVPYVGAQLLLLGCVTHLPYVNGMGEQSTSLLVTSAASALSVVALAILGAYVWHLERDGAKAGPILTATLTVSFVVIAVVFCLMLAINVGGVGQIVLERLVYRTARVAGTVAVLAVVLKAGLDPYRPFAIACLVPSMAAKVVLSLTQAVSRQLPGGIPGGVILVGMYAIVLLMTALFALLCVRSLAGRGDRGDAAADSGDGGRRRACEDVASSYGLSNRERDVLYYLSQGYSAQRTCEALSLSAGTVNSYSSSLYRKLGIHSKQELIDLVNERERSGARS